MFYDLITSQYMFVFVLVVALTLIVMEIFVPSLGLLGIAGIYLLLNALKAIPNIHSVYVYIFISLIISLLISIILIKLMMGKNAASKFVLQEGGPEGPSYVSSDLIGKEGLVEKDLRPSGEAIIDGSHYDVISYGEFIGKGEAITVVKIEGNKIYCRRK